MDLFYHFVDYTYILIEEFRRWEGDALAKPLFLLKILSFSFYVLELIIILRCLNFILYLLFCGVIL